MRLLGVLLAAGLCGGASLALADEDNDLNLIPDAVGKSDAAAVGASAAPTPPATSQQRYFIEDAATLASRRNHLVVPSPPPAPFDWQNRTSLDATDHFRLADGLTLSLSDRFNLTEESHVDFPTRQNQRNDFREGYVSWEPLAQSYIEAGRVNVRNGVALGFNPTDFFKTRTSVDQASLDPSVIRQDRLGTLMAQGQRLWDGGSLTLAYAPKVYGPSRLGSGLQHGLDPRFDHTNGANRFLLAATYDLADLSPQALYYHEGTQSRLGLNLSHPIGQSIVAYGEWAGGRQPTLIESAIEFGKRSGTLPAAAPTLPPTDTSNSFRNDLALGASWASAAKITINLEYHYHQAGFSKNDWRNWFNIGSTRGLPPGVSNELWFIRGFANDQQEPLARHQAFIRADWTDAFVTNLELTAFAIVDLYDGSVLTQVAASYNLTDAWTLGGFLSTNLGGSRTEHGSSPQEASAILQVTRFF